MSKRCFLISPLIVCLLILINVSPVYAFEKRHSNSEQLVWGRVVNIISETKNINNLAGTKVTNQIIRIRLTSGKFQGREVTVMNTLGFNPVYDMKVAEGEGVVVALDLKDGKINDAAIADHLREPQIYILVAIFIILLLLIGWKKGLKALGTLLLTLGMIIGLLLPGILRGYNPVILTVVLSIVVTIINTLIIGGRSRKSLASICGTIGGLVIAGLIALKVGKAACLTGLGNEESAMLLYLPHNIHLNIQGLLFAGIIIGALGAVMDISMSVASAIEEVQRVNPDLTIAQLIGSGMNVGRDIIGIMANTLILAYTGGSISLLLMFMAYHDSLTLIMNLDTIASEIVRALSGSIGMIIVVPLTAVIAGLLFKNRSQKAKPAPPTTKAEEKEYNFLDNWVNR